jgi:RimJ/RimL family protein N-acetyltransferase
MLEYGNLSTERTQMRKFTLQDAYDLYQLNLDQEVLQYTGDIPFVDIHQAMRFIEKYDQYTSYGVGRLAVTHKIDSSFLGWCGLKYDPTSGDYDIGFRLFKAYWNQGYATETAKKCIDFGFKALQLKKIIGRARQENVASIRALEKIGLVYCTDIEKNGVKWAQFEITI